MWPLRLCLSLSSILVASVAEARPARAWTYKELLSEADIVAVVDASPPMDTENTDVFLGYPVVQILTTLTVHVVLKGDTKKESLEFVHYRYGKIDRAIINGAQFVHFLAEKTGCSRPKYLVFLKRRKDGRYEAVSGQIDPVDSVRLLEAPRHMHEKNYSFTWK